MITLKSFFRKKSSKIYLFILVVLLLAYFLFMSLIAYFTNMQDEIYSDYSEVVIINNQDIYDELVKIENLDNIKQSFAFEENKDYDVFTDASYRIFDNEGNLVDSHENVEDKVIWEVLEREQLDDFVIVLPARDFNYELRNDEIIIAITDFWFDSYDESYFTKMLNQKIGFIYLDDNIEFKILDVIRSDKSFLIISDDLYDKLINQKKLYVYTANITSMREESRIKNSLLDLVDNDAIVSVASYYKNDASDNLSELYDLIDILKLISYISIVVLLVIFLIIIKNVISDAKKNLMLDKKLGFTKIQIKIKVFEELATLLFFAFVISISIYFILIFFLNTFLKMVVPIVNINTCLQVLIVGFAFDFIIVILSRFNFEK